ncbi:MAG: class I SAM-dependent methyltransferase [Candidatus Bathyarchaeota archaeon]|nr:class I SAM-dependent methyltransferase [Candidatus Bathyarchaeota archaeon]
MQAWSDADWKVFFEVHSGLPRENPGDDETTKKAYQTLSNLPEHPHILDVGCGSGAQTVALAMLSHGQITALDVHQPFLENLKRKAEAEGVSDRIQIVKGDMCAMDYAAKSFGVIWAEGSIFIIGFEKGLHDWKRLLTDKGYLVASELSWFKREAPEEIQKFFAEVYPQMKTVEDNLAIARNAGYRVVGWFPVPESSWWKNYYAPIEAKLPALKSKYQSNAEALSIIAWEEREIEMFRKYSAYYGSVFYILQAQA